LLARLKSVVQLRAGDEVISLNGEGPSEPMEIRCSIMSVMPAGFFSSNRVAYLITGASS
jgi:hypothetical protein